MGGWWSWTPREENTDLLAKQGRWPIDSRPEASGLMGIPWKFVVRVSQKTRIRFVTDPCEVCGVLAKWRYPRVPTKDQPADGNSRDVLICGPCHEKLVAIPKTEEP